MKDKQIIHAFKHMQVPLLIVGSGGVIAHHNDASSRLFGYDRDGLVGRSILDILAIESVEALHAHIEPPSVDAVVKGMVGHTREGAPLLLAVNMTVWTDAEHGLQHALALTDIDAFSLANRASKNELERANKAIKGARIGIFEYSPVDESVIVSDIWRELTDLDAPDLDVQAAWRARVHPDDLEAALKPVQMCIENSSERGKSEHRFRAKDGSHWRWMETDVSVAKRDKTGRVTRIIGAMIDITERKAAENSLRKSQEQFRSAFEDATEGKAIVAPDGHYLKVNSALCDMLGYSEEELLQTNFQSISHGDDLAEDLLKFNQLKANLIATYQIEKRYVRSSGAVMWGLLSVGMVKDSEGNPDHFIAQISDVTEQRRLNEMKSRFVATVSHELRTPLTSVLGALALLSSMDEEPFSDEAQRLLYIAQENGNRLNALINDILDFEKFSARQMRFTLWRYQIVTLIEDAILANMATADKFDVKFLITCEDRSVTAHVDAKRFQQVMTNLMTNAAKFAEKGSTIDLVLKEQGAFLKVSVVNSGEGIPDAFRDQAFKPFAQAKSPTTGKAGGTGLGLNITKQIVEQTGGEIGFESDPGGRTTFWFTVPVEEPTTSLPDPTPR